MYTGVWLGCSFRVKLIWLEQGVSEIELFYMKKAWGVTDKQRAGGKRATLQLYNKIEPRAAKAPPGVPGRFPFSPSSVCCCPFIFCAC